MQRHRHQEFIRFLNAIEAQVPDRKIVHVILDNYAAHKHPKVRQWLGRHPRFTFHFTRLAFHPGATAFRLLTRHQNPSLLRQPSPIQDLLVAADGTVSSPKAAQRPASTSSQLGPDEDFVEFTDVPPFCTIDRELSEKKGE